MSDSWNLGDFSQALGRIAERNEETRKTISDQLEAMGPVLFLRDNDGPDGHGVGWFKMQQGFFAFRRYSNGYESRPCDSLHFETVQKLFEAMQ